MNPLIHPAIVRAQAAEIAFAAERRRRITPLRDEAPIELPKRRRRLRTAAIARLRRPIAAPVG